MNSNRELSSTYVIRNGRVIDPASGVDRVADVTVVDGVITAVGSAAQPPLDPHDVVDAGGKLVVPGLIDFHAHVYKGSSCYGLDPDRAGVLSGVTHVNDLGSMGWMTFVEFNAMVASHAETNLTCFPSILPLGIPENWCVGTPELAAGTIRPDLLLALAEEHDDVIRGVKVHIARGVMSYLGDDIWRAYNAAREVADALSMHVYVHLGDLVPRRPEDALADSLRIPVETVERMKPGDVLGHCFTHRPGGLVDADGKVSPAARLATDKGIKHEVGHGLNFSFARARYLLDAGILPDIISSDIHGTRMHVGQRALGLGLDASLDEPHLSWSMVGTMSKVLALGVPLPEVIRMATIEPARALRLDDCKGSLTVGYPAEITVLELVEGDFRLVDSVGDEAPSSRLLLPVQTFIGRRTWRCQPFTLPEFRNEYLALNPALRPPPPLIAA